MENKLETRIYKTRKELGDDAAKIAASAINELLASQPYINIIFAAAPSQNEFLAALIQQEIDWTRINAFHMDEYIGLEANAPQLFANFLKRAIFEKVEFKSVNYLNGNVDEVNKECERYESLLQNNPPNIVCMGIGENGHIAFNDPPVANFADEKLVKVVELDEACRQQQVNDGCFKSLDEVPTHALTLTIPALMVAPKIFCIVPGKQKAQAVYNTLHKPQEHQYPSTILRSHSNAILFLDGDSSSLL